MLNAWLLWFLPLAMVPILLHLITLYRLRTVELSTFRFLMDSYIQQRRKVKLLEFLLMLLRTAFVALIVLALARPVLQKFNFLGGGTGRDVALIIDAGASMSVRTGPSSSLERARDAAAQVVKLLGPEDYVRVIRAGERPETLVSRFASGSEPLLAAIQGITPGLGGSNLAAALAEAAGAPPRGPRITYVFSDANRRAWSSLADGAGAKAATGNGQLVVLHVGPAEPVVNLAAVGEAPRPLHAIAGLPVKLTAAVANTSPDRPADPVLAVSLDGQQTTQMGLSLGPGQRLTRSLHVTPTKAGLIQGRFQLPADAFPEDDAFLFCLNVEPRLNVLIVAPPPGATPGTTPGATPGAGPGADAPDLFLRAALTAPLAARGEGSAAAGTPAPAPGAAPPPPAVAAPGAPGAGGDAENQRLAASLQVGSVPYTALTDAQLAAADVVLLSNVPLDPALGPKLQQYAQEGGGLFVFPGPNTQPEAYAAYLFSALGRPGLPGLPGLPGAAAPIGAAAGTPPPPLGFLPPVGNPDDEAHFQPLSGIDLTHPILSAFAESERPFFATTRLYRYLPIRLPGAGSQAGAAGGRPQVLMRLPDRTPVLVETRLGDGRVMVAGFAATPEWSNLPLRPEFVPLMLRAVAHLRRPTPASAPSAVGPHEPAVIRLTDRWASAQVECIDPAGRPTTIPLHRDGREMIGAMLQTDRKGFYRFVVTPAPGSPDTAAGASAPERVELGFAVNMDVSAADFASLNEAQVRDLFKPVDIAYLRGTREDPVLKNQLTQKHEVWRTLIWATFAVIGLEFLLSTLRPSRARGPIPTTTSAGRGTTDASARRGHFSGHGGATGGSDPLNDTTPFRRLTGRLAALVTGEVRSGG